MRRPRPPRRSGLRDLVVGASASARKTRPSHRPCRFAHAAQFAGGSSRSRPRTQLRARRRDSSFTSRMLMSAGFTPLMRLA